MLKRYFVVIIFLFIVLIELDWGGDYIKSALSASISPFDTTPIEQIEQPLPTKSPILPGTPKVIYIPKIGVKALIESVGRDSEGRMDVPTRDEDVGWYSPGFKPGEKGSALIDGHLDTVTGEPAIFYNLSKLELGDEVIVIDEKYQQFKFIVIKKESYNFDSVSLPEIFASANKARLNLITCDGYWDRSTKNYSKRIIVFTQLQDDLE